MKHRNSLGGEPARFLGRFALVALILFLVWRYVEDCYIATLIPPANWLLASQGLPLAFEQRGHFLLIVYGEPTQRALQLQFKGHELVYMNTLTAAALFATLPGWRSGSRVQWAVAVLMLLWVMHMIGLCAGAYSAVQDYLDGLPPERRAALLASGLAQFSGDQAEFFGRLVGSWGTWGTPVLVLLPWVLSAWRYLGFEGRSSPAAGS